MSNDRVENSSMTLAGLIDLVSEKLEEEGLYFGHGTDNALDEATWLVLHAIGASPVAPLGKADRILLPRERAAVSALLKQRISTRKPLAYLTGSAWFCGLEFKVNEHVLVPRSPIAEMISDEFFPWLRFSPIRVLDLCTGSGCIAIASAIAFPDAQIHATDISPEALAVAQQNIAEYDLQHQISLFKADVYQGLPRNTYDLIVSNPPYVSHEEMETLPLEYRREPVLGLAADDNGLAIVKRILHDAHDWLTPEGVLIVEVGNSQAVLEEAYPNISFIWVDFERGGTGVFVMTREMLDEVAGQLL